jgi:predicted acyltransferase
LYAVLRGNQTPLAVRAERLLSLDAFRGIAIAGMILVNNPGTWRHVYRPLQHAIWNGWTPADLIFPFFLFTVGVAITLSMVPSLERGENRRHLLAKMLRRTLTIFGLGIMLNGFPLFDLSVLRIPGVLQRIALCYCFASITVLLLRIRGQSLTVVTLLIGYWAMMKLVPVPGHVSDGLGPDTNLAAYIDNALLHGHLLHAGWDPEGLLSTLPAIGTTLCGVLTGHWLRSAPSQSARALGLFVAGNIALACGAAMGLWLPINKSLWTSSYAVFTVGVALNLFATCYWLIDVKRYRRWAVPFVVYGTNPIVAYVLSSLLAKILLLWTVGGPDGSRIPFQQYVFETFFLPLARPINASLFYALAYVTLWLGITAFLYRQRVIIKI